MYKKLVLIFTIWCMSSADCLLSNTSYYADGINALEEYHEGQTCTPGKKYRVDCNTCFCKNDGGLMCSNIACDVMKNVEKIAKKFIKPHKAKGRSKKRNDLPVLRSKRTCRPGKIFMQGCLRCICNEKKEAVCSDKELCVRSRDTMVMSLDDIHPRLKPDEVENLPTLPNRQVPCHPGRVYRVDCNACMCLANKNLVCDEFACLSYDDTHRIIADDSSGKQCSMDEIVRDHHECIKCECKNGTTRCDEILDCVTDEEKLNPIWKDGKPKLTIDIYKDKCIPKAVYRYDCNNCYCQEDKTLRCTLKTCLNYLQAQALEERTAVLLRQGLL